jgi:hypothetical protein
LKEIFYAFVRNQGFYAIFAIKIKIEKIMKKIIFYPLAITLTIGGITLMLTHNEVNLVLAFGVVLTIIGIILLVALIFDDKLQSNNDKISNASKGLETQIQNYTNQLEEVGNKLNLLNDARFIPDGFIGLQRQSILLELNTDTGNDRVRMAIMGHLPSYMRLKPLDETTGKKLYHNWEPPHYIPEYIELTNKRKKAFDTFLENNGVVREIYEKDKIQQYVTQHSTFHDKVEDPIEEIKERLEALKFYINKYPNYYICLLESETDHSRHHFLLKQNVGLVLDLRTTDIKSHFTKSLEGLFTDSKSTLEQFEQRFSSAWVQQEKLDTIAFIDGLLATLK